MKIAELLFLLLVLFTQNPAKKDSTVVVATQRAEIVREIQTSESLIKDLETRLAQEKEKRLWLYGRLNEWNRMPDSSKVKIRRD